MFNSERIRLWLCLVLLIGCCCMAGAVSAQGLVGAPVDPRYGQSNEIGNVIDGGYSLACDRVLAVTDVSVVLACLLGCYRSRKVSGQRLCNELLLMVLIPVAIYFGGMFAINLGGLGALGGCPIA